MKHQVKLYDSAEIVGIYNPVIASLDGIKIANNREEFNDEIEQIEKYLQNDMGQILNSEVFNGFKQLFKNLGYEEQITAGERLLDSISKKGFKYINNVVDACNIISLKYGYGIGLHDGSKVQADIIIERANGTEQIIPIFKEKAQQITQGDLIYSSNKEVIAWLGRKDVDSDKYKLTESTEKVLIVALGNMNTSEEFNRHICDSIYQLLKKNNDDLRINYLPVIKSEKNKI